MSYNSFSIFKKSITDLNDAYHIAREDLAAIILETLNTGWRNGNFMSIDRFISELSREYKIHEIPHGIQRTIAEAWQWLISEGFIAPTPDSNALRVGAVFITKTGKTYPTSKLVQCYMQSKILQVNYLHHRLVDIIPALFSRGDYETAIFKAFKEVEIAVREACGLPDSIIGDGLMRRAFSDESLLKDIEENTNEQQSISHLFAGAHGYFRNPIVHRETDFKNPIEAAEIIMFASYLLRTVDKRSKKTET